MRLAGIAICRFGGQRDFGEAMTLGNDLAFGNEHMLDEPGSRGGRPDQPAVWDEPTVRLSVRAYVP